MIPRWAIKPLRERLIERLIERGRRQFEPLEIALATLGEACEKANADIAMAFRRTLGEACEKANADIAMAFRRMKVP